MNTRPIKAFIARHERAVTRVAEYAAATLFCGMFILAVADGLGLLWQ